MWLKIPWLIPDLSLIGSEKYPHFFPDPHLTYLQKYVKKMELNR